MRRDENHAPVLYCVASMKIITNTLVLACSLVIFQTAVADTVTIAVASNFSATAELLADSFRQQTGHKVRVSTGSSGKLYAQILHGAPFDVFMSADELRPKALEDQGLTVAGSRFSYAQGQLVLWSQRKQYAGADCLAVLRSLDFNHLAIANPRTAPYGAAAQDWLEHLGLWSLVQSKLVTGENIGQTFHFAASGSAALALVAASQLKAKKVSPGTCQYAVPATGHRPILQQAVLLKRARKNQAAKEFVIFLQSAKSTDIIGQHGYLLP